MRRGLTSKRERGSSRSGSVCDLGIRSNPNQPHFPGSPAERRVRSGLQVQVGKDGDGARRLGPLWTWALGLGTWLGGGRGLEVWVWRGQVCCGRVPVADGPIQVSRHCSPGLSLIAGAAVD